MLVANFEGKKVIKLIDKPDPKIIDDTDVIVRVVRSCVCGSDLWYYRGILERQPGNIGHEYIGVVDGVGSAVSKFRKGDFVIAPFTYNDGTCAACAHGFYANCVNGDVFGSVTNDGGQGQMVRCPFGDATLVKVPGNNFSEDQLASFTALCDVMCTGHHAAVSAGVGQDSVVAVVGDGAVGLCAVLASHRLGAKRIIALSRHPNRQKMALEFGASDIVELRGDDAIKSVLELTDQVGVDSALECVGSDESISTCAGITRIGGMIGAVGVPTYKAFQYQTLFWKNVGIRGGVAPSRQYIADLLEDVLANKINPGRVFDQSFSLEEIQAAYEAMDDRRAIKSLLKVSEL